MVTNEAGEIAIRRRQPAPILVRNTPTKKEYYFDVRAAISLAWVNPLDVENVLGRKKGCCDGRGAEFSKANEDAVRIWTNGGGR